MNVKVYPINYDTEEVDEPKLVRWDVDDTVRDLKVKMASLLKMDASSMHIAEVMFSNEPKYLDKDDAVISLDPNVLEYKYYVSSALDDDPNKSFQESRFKKILGNIGYIISLSVTLPGTDIGKRI